MSFDPQRQVSQTSSRADPTAARADVTAQPLACTWSDGGAGVAWVHVAGELDLATSRQLAQALHDAPRRAHVVVVDLRDLIFIDTAGVHVIIDAAAAARRSGRRLVAVRGPGHVDAVFTLAGQSGDIEILDPDAWEPPRSGPPPVHCRITDRGTRPPRQLDAESRAWWERLHGMEPTRGWAIAELYERLRREAAFHIRHRVGGLSEFPRSDIDDLATQAAGDALVVLLRKLEDYRGDSQFWTWARRFAALEAPVSIRRRLGHDRVGSRGIPSTRAMSPTRRVRHMTEQSSASSCAASATPSSPSSRRVSEPCSPRSPSTASPPLRSRKSSTQRPEPSTSHCTTPAQRCAGSPPHLHPRRQERDRGREGLAPPIAIMRCTAARGRPATA